MKNTTLHFIEILKQVAKLAIDTEFNTPSMTNIAVDLFMELENVLDGEMYELDLDTVVELDQLLDDVVQSQQANNGLGCLGSVRSTWLADNDITLLEE